MTERRYVFGDNAAAAERLELLAEVFGAPTRSLLSVLPRGQYGVVVDLGCGPGHTTALLSDELRPFRLIGLDISDAFLRLAQSSQLKAEWMLHDVAKVPFPTPLADLMFARLVVAHLPEPVTVLTSWISQINKGGFLVLEEDVEIVTEDPWLQRYESMASELVTARGGNLNVGRDLGQLRLGGSEVAVNRVYEHRVPAAVAARLFKMNFAVWRHDPLVVDGYSASELDELDEALHEVVARPSTNDVLFRIRQIVMQRIS
jgi:trans-aconitate 2-methyltransferase